MRKNFTLRLSPNLHRHLLSLAEYNQRSMAGQLRWLIKNAMSNTSNGRGVVLSEDKNMGQQSKENIEPSEEK